MHLPFRGVCLLGSCLIKGDAQNKSGTFQRELMLSDIYPVDELLISLQLDIRLCGSIYVVGVFISFNN